MPLGRMRANSNSDLNDIKANSQRSRGATIVTKPNSKMSPTQRNSITTPLKFRKRSHSIQSRGEYYRE
jgi:hypothetical protein